MQQKIVSFILIILFIAGFSATGWCSKIVYPWRASNAIVKAGETFEVWFDADEGQTINEVQLSGPYNAVQTTINVETGSWVYDEWSGNEYDTKITVTVPADAPEERYDLIVKTSSGDNTSLAAVKVVKKYKDIFYVLHISDAHRWQGSYDTHGVILKEVSTVIDIANIIDPAIIVETGDNHYPNTNNMDGNDVKSTKNRIIEYMNGTTAFNGMNDAFAPVFTVPGNHCTPNKAYNREPGYDSNNLSGTWIKAPAEYWNKYYGLQYHYVKYGDARFIGVNNAWCPDTGGGTAGYVPNYKWQLDGAINWLNGVGGGNFVFAFQHVPQESIPPVYNALNNAGYEPGLMVAGHIHRTNSNPMNINGKNIIYTVDTPRDGQGKAPFNLYRVDAKAGTYEPVGNPGAVQHGLETEKRYSTSKLKLTYSNSNDGASATNTATITNKFEFSIEEARVRFVMPKGSYTVSNGYIMQTIENETLTIVDVRLHIEANSTSTIIIEEAVLCPDDPNKTEPGLCGCGVPEGSCDPSDLIVVGGSGDGSYYPYESLFITAGAAPEGKMFDAWVVDNGNPYINDVNSPTAIVQLRGEETTITATFKNIPRYTLTVNNGTGDGEYYAGESIVITADTPPENKIFNGWIIDEGNPEIDFKFFTTTTLIMPMENTTVTAAFIDDPNATAISRTDREQAVKIYPNPLNDHLLSIEIGGDGFSNFEVSITNLLGKTVYSKTVHNKQTVVLNTNGLLNASVYFVTVKSEKSIITKRLIVR